jgi:hypothetical protein
MSAEPKCPAWDDDAWRVWAIDRSTVIAALSFCMTLDGAP